jgi:hypothetical protein
LTLTGWVKLNDPSFTDWSIFLNTFRFGTKNGSVEVCKVFSGHKWVENWFFRKNKSEPNFEVVWICLGRQCFIYHSRRHFIYFVFFFFNKVDNHPPYKKKEGQAYGLVLQAKCSTLVFWPSVCLLCFFFFF